MDNQTRIQQGLDYIEENLQTELTAAELAERAGFSLFHYYRLFQRSTGLPVMQYILRRRLLHGVYAMRQGTGKTEAAFRYGFDTYAGFYKAFCREFCITPSAFLDSGRAKCPYRIDITKEGHRMITHKKAAQILQNWGMEDQTITDIYYEGNGTKNDNAYYVGKQYILKFTCDFEKLQKHLTVSKTLQQVSQLSSAPIAAMDGAEYVCDDNTYFYLTRCLPGEPMTARSFDQADGRFVGEIIGQLHIALGKLEDCVNEADLLSTVQNWALPKAKEALQLSDTLCDDYLRHLSRLYPTLPRQIIHRDLNPSNIICDETGWGFVDFELSERNVRIYDPCYASTAVLSETFGRHDNWLEIYRNIIWGYDSVAKLSEAERKAIPYVILANQFVCVAWFAEQEKYQELLEVNKKMTLWLIRNFEELCNL